MRITPLLVGGLCFTVLAPLSALAYSQGYYQGYYYGEGYYYGQAAYYSQTSYYSQSGYYSQGYYYGESGYYAQSYYYGQSTYLSYAQSSYTVTLTKPATIKGDAQVVGALSKGGGSFAIDDPIDPKNKILYHSFVESPDVKNIYDGVATLDTKGNVTIQMPDYFLALNGDFRYLVTAMGEPMPDLHLSSQIRRRYIFWGPAEFTITGGVAGGRVSWQVTGIRHDPYIRANPIVPEVEKGPNAFVDKGDCVYKPLCE